MTSARHFLNDGVGCDGCVSGRKLSKEFTGAMSRGEDHLISLCMFTAYLIEGKDLRLSDLWPEALCLDARNAVQKKQFIVRGEARCSATYGLPLPWDSASTPAT